MATTTNYGWVTPDDTALVKDGAAAIRTLGSSADTTTKNLNPETTLGDISFRSSTSNVNTRLGIGTAGQVLTIVAGLPAYATPAVSASGLTLIDEVTFSASQSVNVNDVFSATYNNYKIIGNMKGDSFACDATLKLRVGGTNTSADYINQIIASTGANAPISQNNVFGTDEVVFGELGSTFSIQTYDVTAPFLEQRTSMVGNYGFAADALRVSYAAHTPSTSFTGFALIISAAASGTVSVYGYAKE